MIQAYALQRHGQINIRTVSETERAVMVNALVILAKENVTIEWTDTKIKSRFLSYADIGDVVKVHLHLVMD